MNKTLIAVIIIILVILGGFVVLNKKEVGLKEPVNIGVLIPITGRFSSIGEDSRNGIGLAKIDALEKYGIEFNVIYEDSAGDPKVAVPAANKLVGVDKVQVIIAGLGSSANLAVTPFVEQSKVVFITNSAAPKLNEAGEYIFKIAPDVDGEVIRMEKLLTSKGTKKVGMIYDAASDSLTGGKDLFIKLFEQNGGQVFAEGYDVKTAADFRTSLTKLKQKNPEAYYFLGVEKTMGSAVKQAREIGITQPIFGWYPFESQEFIDIAGQAAEGIVFTAFPFSCQDGTEAMLTYCQNYKTKFAGRDPQPYGADLYDALMLVAKVIDDGAMNSDEIRAGLLEVKNYEGADGLITLDKDGNVRDKDFVFRMVKDGKFIKYEQ